MNHKLDRYSMMIVSTYFKSSVDFINLICVCANFNEILEMYRYNPISITSTKLFPKINTQYIYSDKDILIPGINQYKIYQQVTYEEYLYYNKCYNSLSFRRVIYTSQDSYKYGKRIPTIIKALDNTSMYNFTTEPKYCIPTTIQSIGNSCFSHCSTIEALTLQTSLTSLGFDCFKNCISLTSVTLPSSIRSIPSGCFYNCYKLQSIVFGDGLVEIGKLQNVLSVGVFQNCIKLEALQLPTTVTILGDNCFNNCKSLKNIEIPINCCLGSSCFKNCILMKNSTTIPTSYFS